MLFQNDTMQVKQSVKSTMANWKVTSLASRSRPNQSLGLVFTSFASALAGTLEPHWKGPLLLGRSLCGLFDLADWPLPSQARMGEGRNTIWEGFAAQLDHWADVGISRMCSLAVAFPWFVHPIHTSTNNQQYWLRFPNPTWLEFKSTSA